MSATLPNSFFSGWIILIVVIGFSYLFFLLLSSHFSKKPPHKHVVWDETLSERDEILPQVWFWMFLTSVILSLVYIILFPGLGSYPGILKWTSSGHHHSEKVALDARVKSVRDSWILTSPSELALNESAMTSAASLYMNNCVGCHGADAGGLMGYYPNLKDDAWIWGGDAESIYTSIKEGRTGIMPGWSVVISEEQASSLAEYVLSISQNDLDTNNPNHQVFTQFCAACHGPTANGNTLLGAPSLQDTVWLHSNDAESVKNIILNGIGPSVMPAQKKRLTEAEIKLLVAWLMRSQL